jgi:hypothetical protein
MKPLRAKYSAEGSQTGAVSKLALEFHHSITTLPLKCPFFSGRRTIMRVLYGTPSWIGVMSVGPSGGLCA